MRRTVRRSYVSDLKVGIAIGIGKVGNWEKGLGFRRGENVRHHAGPLSPNLNPNVFIRLIPRISSVSPPSGRSWSGK